MSESEPLVSDTPDANAPERAAPASAGTLLRQGRVAAGLHIAALAVSLKVPVRRLEALEADRYDLLPDAVFVRALASSVCRVLRLDTAPVLALLPVSIPPRLSGASIRTNDTYNSGSPARGLPLWRSVSKPVVVSVAALLVATLVLVVWPFVPAAWLGRDAGPDLAAATTPTASQSQPVEGVVTSVVSANVASVNSLSMVETNPVAATPTVLPTSAAVPAEPALAPVSDIVIFRTSASSWVEVTDAKGAVVLRRMLAAGEMAGASGALPLNAVVGRADVTQVQVRGQAFDLSSVARENVARFEVK